MSEQNLKNLRDKVEEYQKKEEMRRDSLYLIYEILANKDLPPIAKELLEMAKLDIILRKYDIKTEIFEKYFRLS
jgi:hypothetical protein